MNAQHVRLSFVQLPDALRLIVSAGRHHHRAAFYAQ